MKGSGDRFAAIGNRYAGYAVYDNAGENIGEADGLFVDEKEKTEYIRVKMSSLGRSALVPSDIARVNERRRLIEFSDPGEVVEDAPSFGEDEEITPEFEQQVRDFFRAPGDGLLESPTAAWAVPFLLLGLQERDYYGHELAQKMSCFGLGAMPTAAVYRALRRMEKESLVVSEPDDRGLSRRRCSITEAGEAYLEFWAHSLRRYQEEIDLFFRLYNRQPALGSRGRSTTRA